MLYPLTFHPIHVARIWGGGQIAPPKNGVPVGESWLVSPLAGCESVVANGRLKGLTLGQVCNEYPKELFGQLWRKEACSHVFPLLIKLIDTAQPLSVQVHPDDSYARQHGEPNGKSEAWYILDAQPGSTILLGLKDPVDYEEIREAVRSGTLPRLLRELPAIPGECYHVPAGEMHSVGGGIRLIEVQQPSDRTFRLYDWGRTDAGGLPRELHLQQGLEAASCSPYPLGSGSRMVQARENTAQLVDDPHFTISILQLSPRAELSTDGVPVVAIPMCPASVTTQRGDSLALAPLQAVLIPASVGGVDLEAKSGGRVLVATPARQELREKYTLADALHC